MATRISDSSEAGLGPYSVHCDTSDARSSAERIAAAGKLFDKNGFVIIEGLLTTEEIESARQVVTDTINNDDRQFGDFASQVDIRYGRRDFCPIELSSTSRAVVELLCKRLEPLLTQYCERSDRVMEISTLTSNYGCSHQYLHRDPPGVLCLFLVVDDISVEQGSTAFVPGTDNYSHALDGLGDARKYLVELYRLRGNCAILARNILLLLRLLVTRQLVSLREFRHRIFSRCKDDHQPNLYTFMTGKNSVFHLLMLHPKKFVRMIRSRSKFRENFKTVYGALPRGAVILYRSEILHAGRDNRTDRARMYFNVNIGVDSNHEKQWSEGGYTPHRGLLEQPLQVGDFWE